MAGSIETGGVVEGYKKFNTLVRNGAIGVALAGAALGAGGLILPALVVAGGNQLEIFGIEKYQNWRKNGGHIFP